MKIQCVVSGIRTFCLLTAFSLSGSIGCGPPPSSSEKVVPKVKVVAVEKQTTGQSRRVSGKVTAAARSELSFGVSGKVIEVIVEEGQAVVKGQLLASLEVAPFELALRKARAQLSAARASLEEVESRYNRTSALFKQEAASRKDLDKVTAELTDAQSKVEAAIIVLDQAEIDFSRTSITAPFAGKVVSVPLEPFQEISANQGAIVLQSEDALEVEVLVPETLIREVDYGQVVKVTFATRKGLTASGVVTTIGAEAEAGNAFPVVVALNQVNADLRPGMTASVTFNFNKYLEGQSAFLIPLSAIALDVELKSGGSESTSEGKREHAPVYLYNPEAGRLEVTSVLVGDLRGNEVEVFEGLKKGDLIVTAGVPFLRDKMQVERWIPRGASDE